jgi:hypothetical protein
MGSTVRKLIVRASAVWRFLFWSAMLQAPTTADQRTSCTV